MATMLVYPVKRLLVVKASDTFVCEDEPESNNPTKEWEKAHYPHPSSTLRTSENILVLFIYRI